MHARDIERLARRAAVVGLTAALALASSAATAAKVKLAWDPNSPEENITGYVLHYDIRPGPPYQGTLAVQGPSPIEIPLEMLENPAEPEFELHGFPSCHPLFFNLKAYRIDGDQRVESAFTGEISAKIPYRPQWVEAAQTPAGVVVSWDGFPSGDEGTLQRYLVYYSTSPSAPADDLAIAVAPTLPVALEALANPHAPQAMLPAVSGTSVVHLAVATECSTGERRVSEVTSIELQGAAAPNNLSGEMGCALGPQPLRGQLSAILLALVGLWLFVRRRARRLH